MDNINIQMPSQDIFNFFVTTRSQWWECLKIEGKKISLRMLEILINQGISGFQGVVKVSYSELG